MIRLAAAEDFERIIDLHSSVLSWSINGRLGREHIAQLYRSLFDGDDFFVVVMDDPRTGELAGMASGTTDAAAARRRIRAGIPWSVRAAMLRNALTNIGEIADIIETVLVIPALPTRRIPAEILTWVSRRGSAAGAIAGRRCFDGVLAHFAELGEEICVAQVLKRNRGPNSFHALRGTHRAYSLLANNIYVVECR